MNGVVLALLTVAPWQSLDAGARSEQIQRLKSSALEERFLLASEGFLGTPYVLSPLGEGQGHDPDPLIRYDAADCLTMVEQSMALALAPDEARVVEALNHIRYEAEPSYEGRLHVMEAQWLPVNVSKGLLEDVTREYGKDATRRVSKRITEETWAEKGGKGLALPSSAQAKGEFFVQLIPSDRAEAALAIAPAGSIIVVVRADRPRLVTRITHVAVLVQKASGPHLRHASRTFKRVVDEPVEKYLKRNLEFGAWTVEGVAVYRLRAPAWLASFEPAVSEADAGSPTDAGVIEARAEADAGVPDAGAGPSAVVEVHKACGCTAAVGPVLAIALLVAWRRRRRRAPRLRLT